MGDSAAPSWWARAKKPHVALIGVAAVVAAKVLAPAIGFLLGYVFVSTAVSTIRERLNSTPEGRQGLAGIVSVGGDPASLLEPYKDSSEAWFQALGMKAAASALDPAEQEELLRYRLTLAEHMPDSVCAAAFFTGTGPGLRQAASYLSVAPDSQRNRIAFVVGRAIGRYLQGEKVVADTFQTQSEALGFFRHYASPADLATFAEAQEPGASAHAQCSAARILFSLPQRAEAGSRDRLRYVRFVMEASSGKK